MSNKVYDLIILGAGPAGITAAVYAARKKLDFLVVTQDVGGQAALSSDIENYTGYQFITGPDLASKFYKHMQSFGIKVCMPEKSLEVKEEEGLIKTITNKLQYLSKSLIVATGKRPRPLGVEGEMEFRNRGLTYCATCDGPVFKDKKVAIIGGGNSALDAALQMVNISPQVYIINIADSLSGDEVMIDKINKSANAEVFNKARIKRIFGDTFVRGIEVEKRNGIFTLDVEGVFVEIGLTPNSEFASHLTRNQQKEIVVDSYNKTNIEGIFAAGDVTNVPEKQIIIACGEGSKASLAVFRYLSTHIF